MLNLTQHPATSEQLEAGVVEPFSKEEVQRLLTFESRPCSEIIRARAAELVARAMGEGAVTAMIGGAPFFMGPLERALAEAGVTPYYAFSVRESTEVPDGAGGVRKTMVFRHAGFVEAVL